MGEKVDVINARGEVIETCLRDESKGRLTRWIQVFLFDDDGHWILQQRARTKTFRPNLIECAVGGQVSAGETFEMAASRELEEELGLKLPLTFAFESWGDYGLCHVFFGQCELGDITAPNAREVERLFKLCEDEVDFLIEKTPFVVMRGFRDSYNVYKQNKNKG